MKTKLTFSKFLHQTLGWTISQGRAVLNFVTILSLHPGTHEISPAPKYVSQLAGSDKDSIQMVYGKIVDKTAQKRFGASNVTDFSYWAWRSCAIAGLQMILAACVNKKFHKSTMQLVEEALSFGGYNIKNDTGWYHLALIKLANKYGIKAHSEKFVHYTDIVLHIMSNNYVLASLTSDHGGHLLLIYGFTILNGRVVSFTTHDPNDYQQKGEGRVYTLGEFNKLFTRRIIVFRQGK